MNIVDKETAELELERFFECMDIDADTARMPEEDAAAFEKLKRRLLRAIENGSLQFNDDGEAVFVPQNKKSTYQETITFHERSGASLMASDGKKKNQDAARTYAMMGDMCKVHPSTFAKLVGNDIKVCEAIFILLMD